MAGPSAKNLGINNQIPSPQYGVFDGGLNVRDFWHTIADNELTLADNMRLDEGGVIRRRNGWTKLVSAAVGSAGNLIGITHGSWLVAGVLTRHVVATDGTKVFWLNGGAWADITGAVAMSPNANTLVSFLSMNNLLIGRDNKNADWTWDGSAGSISLLGGSPPVGEIGIVWQNYYFKAGVSTARARLYYSALGDPATWPAINFIDIPSPYDGDEITGLAILYGNLIVFKRNSIYIVQGTDPTTFVVSKTNAAVGCVSPYSVVSIDNLVYFVSDKGLYALNLSNEKQICYKVQPRYDLAVTNQLQGSLTKNRIQALNYRLRNEIWELADCTANGQDQHDRTIVHNYGVVDKNGDPAVTEHYGYGSIVITLNTNDFIDFTENGGAAVAAQLTAGTYSLGASSADAGTLCALVKSRMEAVGTGTYTVTYNGATDNITITRSTGVFVIKFASGTNTAKNASSALGFSGNDTASAISATGTGGVRKRAGVANVLVATAPSIVADYNSGSIIPMASFYDKYVYIFTGTGATDAAPTGTATNIWMSFLTGYKNFGDDDSIKSLRSVWTSLTFAGGTPTITIGVLGSDFSTETVGTLTPGSPSTFYNSKQPAGQVFGSTPQGKYFKFGMASKDGGTMSFFNMNFDVIWSGRRN